MKWPDLTPILSPIRWAVVDAAATRLYMPERVTQDLDVAVYLNDAPSAANKLATAGFVQGLPVLPLRYLVLMKFQASRARDLGDITQMLGIADEAALEGVRALFKRYAPDDLEDLESLIVLGRLEMGKE